MHAQEEQETAASQDRSSAAGSGSYETRRSQQPSSIRLTGCEAILASTVRR